MSAATDRILAIARALGLDHVRVAVVREEDGAFKGDVFYRHFIDSTELRAFGPSEYAPRIDEVEACLLANAEEHVRAEVRYLRDRAAGLRAEADETAAKADRIAAALGLTEAPRG